MRGWQRRQNRALLLSTLDFRLGDRCERETTNVRKEAARLETNTEYALVWFACTRVKVRQFAGGKKVRPVLKPAHLGAIPPLSSGGMRKRRIEYATVNLKSQGAALLRVELHTHLECVDPL